MLFCECCAKRIKPGREVWLELSVTDGLYYLAGIPAGHVSQGWFSFGQSCARKVAGGSPPEK